MWLYYKCVLIQLIQDTNKIRNVHRYKYRIKTRFSNYKQLKFALGIPKFVHLPMEESI